MIYLSAGHHFDHAKIIKYCERPFVSVDEMNSEMIRRWNGVVSNRDTVYYLGDFTLGGYKTFMKFFSQLNGFISLIPGGHDKRWIKDMKKPTYNMPENLRILPPLLTIKYQKKKITLCHYPLHSWEGSNRGSLHFHAHSHGKIDHQYENYDPNVPIDEKSGIRLDVGVDCWNYFPVSLDLLLKQLDGGVE